MKELGYIILPNGEIIKFGEFHCNINRDNDNSEHFHNPSFREVLRQRKNDFPFIKDIDKFNVTNELLLMGQNGYVTLLNATQGTFTEIVPSMLMANPDRLSDAQKKALISEEATMNYFDNGIANINIIDKNGNIIGEYRDIDDFYSDMVDYKYNSTFNPNNSIVASFNH